MGLQRDHDATFRLPAAWGAFKSRFGYTTEKDGEWNFKAKTFVCDILESADAAPAPASLLDPYASWLTRVAEEAKEVAGLVDPTFDNPKAHKGLSETVTMGGFGVNGNGGMRLFGDPKTGKIGRMLEFAGRLEKGRPSSRSRSPAACGTAPSGPSSRARAGTTCTARKALVEKCVRGLIKMSEISDVPGFIARGTGTDGRSHHPCGSNDQTDPWFFGLCEYCRWSHADPALKAQVLERFVFAARVLYGNK